jgi:hypothetical protein
MSASVPHPGAGRLGTRESQCGRRWITQLHVAQTTKGRNPYCPANGIAKGQEIINKCHRFQKACRTGSTSVRVTIEVMTRPKSRFRFFHFVTKDDWRQPGRHSSLLPERFRPSPKDANRPNRFSGHWIGKRYWHPVTVLRQENRSGRAIIGR